MVTIPGLPNATVPLMGTERLPLDQSGVTKDATVADVANLAVLYGMNQLGVRPERFDAAGTFFTTQGDGDPASVWFAPAIVTASGYGPVHGATGPSKVFTRGVLSAGFDKVYEIEAEFEQVAVNGGEAPYCRIGMRSLLSTYADTDGTPDAVGPVTATMVAAGVAVLRGRFGGPDRAEVDKWADPTTAVWLRPYAEINVGAATSVARLRRLIVRDVTDVVEAENFAFCLGQ